MAGSESLSWHPLVEDFVLVGQKLEKLGFVYHRGSVIVTELLASPNLSERLQ